MSGEITNFGISANLQQRLERGGGYIEVIAATGQVSIDLYSASGQLSDTYENVDSGFFVENKFSSIVIRDKSGANNKVKMLILDNGSKGGTRRQPGVVSVVDSSKDRSISGSAYSLAFSSSGGAVGQFARVTIQNPAGSGKRIVINGLSFSHFVNGAINYGWVGAAAANAHSDVPGSKFAESNGVAAVASVVSVKKDAIAASGGGLSSIMGTVIVPANSTVRVNMSEPIVIKPGSTFCIGDQVDNTILAGIVEYFEESI